MGPGIYEPQPLLSEVILLLGISEVSALVFLKLVADLEVLKLFR